MEKAIFSLFLLVTSTIIVVKITADEPPPTDTVTEEHQQQQLTNLMEAMIGAGDFHTWAHALSAIQVAYPLTATIFIPSSTSYDSDSSSNTTMTPLLMAYHIAPKRLTWSELRLLKPRSRIPTLLPARSILVTNVSVSNFTLDDSRVTYPDIYITSTIAVHGVSTLLDYHAYGGDQDDLQNAVAPPTYFDSLPEWSTSDAVRGFDGAVWVVLGLLAVKILL